MGRRLAKLLAGPLVLAAWVAAGAWWTAGFRGFTTDGHALAAAGRLPRAAPVFPFEDASGDRRSTADFRGRHVLLTFMYLRCPEVCHLVTARLHEVHAGVTELLPDRLVLLSLSLDPGRDTPMALKEWMTAHGAPEGWIAGRLVSPEATTPDAALARLGVWVRRSGSGRIDHGASTFLLDPAGQVLAVFRPEVSAEAVTAAIRGAIE